MAQLNLLTKILVLGYFLRRKLVQRFGLDFVQVRPMSYPGGFTHGDVDLFDHEDFDIISHVLPYTMATPGQLTVLIDAVKYVVRRNVPGDIVECGVWRGGSMMAVALTLIKMNAKNRNLFLYDTYTGMTQPSDEDIDIFGVAAPDVYSEFSKYRQKRDICLWHYASLEEVKSSFLNLDYPSDRILFVQGKVEDTIPFQIPEDISILRLDTDCYSSIKHELEHLYPRLALGGVLMIDDYGTWKGVKKAVDDYFQEYGINMLFTRIDKACRVGVKTLR
jgi:hypothetical protein